MNSFYCKPKNISKNTICVVRYPKKSNSFSNTHNLFTVVNKISEFPQNLPEGIITTSDAVFDKITSKPIIKIDNKKFSLLEGDILLIHPSGNVIKIYDVSSYTNTIFVTEECNSRCITCPQPPKKKDDQDHVNFALQSIELMDSNTQCLGISGGEPTLKWTGLLKILKKCNEYLPNTSLQLLTNARALKDYGKAKILSEIVGDKLFVSIPLYSDIDKIHDTHSGAKGSFWETIDGIYNLERTGIFIELRVLLTKENFIRLPQMAHFIYRTMPFVGCVVFMGVEPIGKALENIDRLWINPSLYSNELELALKLLNQRNIRAAIFNHQLCTISKSLWPLSKMAISEWKVRYLPECEKCSEKINCGGFFFSAEDLLRTSILPIMSQKGD